MLLGDLRNVHTRVRAPTWATLPCAPGPAANITTLPASRSLLRTPGVRAHSWVPHTPRPGGVLLCFFSRRPPAASSSGVQLPSPRLNTPPRVSALLPVRRRLRLCSQSRAGSAWSLWSCRASSHITASLCAYLRFCAERLSLAGGPTLIISSTLLGLPGPVHSCVCFGISSVSVNNPVSNLYWNCIAPVAPVVRN